MEDFTVLRAGGWSPRTAMRLAHKNPDELGSGSKFWALAVAQERVWQKGAACERARAADEAEGFDAEGARVETAQWRRRVRRKHNEREERCMRALHAAVATGRRVWAAAQAAERAAWSAQRALDAAREAAGALQREPWWVEWWEDLCEDTSMTEEDLL